MTDLLERLRHVESSRPARYTGLTTNWLRNPDGPEAADEIERLQAELAALAEAGTGYSQQTVDAIARERDALRAGVEWQPGETAPKDGTKILVYTLFGDYEIGEHFTSRHHEYKERPDGLFERVELSSISAWNNNSFSHWMPLPAPPPQEDKP